MIWPWTSWSPQWKRKTLRVFSGDRVVLVYSWITIWLSTEEVYFQTVVLEKTLESPLDNKEINPVNPKGNQPWIFIGRTDAEAEALIFWPPDVKSRLIRKDPDAGKDWRQEDKGTTEDEVVWWHHWFNGHEFEQAPGDSEGWEAWQTAAHGVVKSQAQLSDWTTTTEGFLDRNYLLGEGA